VAVERWRWRWSGERQRGDGAKHPVHIQRSTRASRQRAIASGSPARMASAEMSGGRDDLDLGFRRRGE
jgi:hypothetical protein